DIFDLEPPRTMSPIVELGQAVVRTTMRFALTILIVGTIAGFAYLVWILWPAPELDKRYLPDLCRSIYSIRPTRLIGSAGYQKLQARSAELVNPFEKRITEQFGVPASAIDRLTLARDAHGELIAVLHTRMDLSIEQIEKQRRAAPDFPKLRFDPVAAVGYELFQETYEEKPGQRVIGRAFCLPQPRLLIVGKRAVVEKILERKGDATLDGPLARAVAGNDFNRSIGWASMRLGPLPAGVVPFDLSLVEASAGNIDINDTVDVRVLLVFADAEAAEKLRGEILLGITDWKRQLYLAGKVPAQVVQLLDTLDTSQSGAQVRLEVTPDTQAVVEAIDLLGAKR
ncbi:MAG: hypothetical protein AB7K24_15605, partial [Gemmataceae bacterium]